MKFGPLALDEAEGAILAHSLRVEGVALRKGHAIGPGDVRALRRAGIERVMAVRAEAGDLDENRAAREVAARLAGAGIGCSAPANGRVRMYAKWPGLAGVEEQRVREVNARGECLALATLAPLARVDRRQVVATLKVLPLAVSKEEMAALSGVLVPAVSVRAFRPLEVALLQTRAGSTRADLLEKTRAVTRARVESLGGVLSSVLHCDHHEGAVADALARLRGRGLDLLLVIGASASVDRRDCVPRGIERAGGEVASLGMPLDPGHLTLLARCGDVPVLVAPGSARSPRRGSFDLLIERFAAGVPVESAEVPSLGVGGLRKRLHAVPDTQRIDHPRPPLAALVLAAGRSRRMGCVNKLLAEVHGVPMLVRVVREALSAQVRAVHVVTGYERGRVEKALSGLDVRLVHNPDFAQGISTSIAAGISALSAETEGALICLGDMPAVSADMLNRILAAFDPQRGREVCVPTCRGKRGNPVLWSRRFFDEIRGIQGDAGARHLIGEHSDVVCEVPIDDTAILLDVDSPDALARFGDRSQPETSRAGVAGGRPPPE